MRTILNNKDFVEIPEYSSYSGVYYRNIHTGEIIREESNDDECSCCYYWATEEEMITRTRNAYIGIAFLEDFMIGLDCKEEIFEFDNTWH